MNSRWRSYSMTNMNDCLQNGGVHEFVYLPPYIVDYVITRNNIKIEHKNIEKKRILFLTMIYKRDIMVIERKEKQ